MLGIAVYGFIQTYINNELRKNEIFYTRVIIDDFLDLHE